jgi:hypothetical protein
VPSRATVVKRAVILTNLEVNVVWGINVQEMSRRIRPCGTRRVVAPPSGASASGQALNTASPALSFWL